ncbi:hypothetical protein ACVWWG_007157 [Bradyrhizobium sp. LB7.2]
MAAAFCSARKLVSAAVLSLPSHECFKAPLQRDDSPQSRIDPLMAVRRQVGVAVEGLGAFLDLFLKPVTYSVAVSKAVVIFISPVGHRKPPTR